MNAACLSRRVVRIVGEGSLPGRVLIIGNISERQLQGEGLLRWKQKDLAVAALSACLQP